MKSCKIHNQIELKYPLISLINESSISNLNDIFKTHYTKSIINNQITVKRKEETYGFWNKIIRTNRQARINEKE